MKCKLDQPKGRFSTLVRHQARVTFPLSDALYVGLFGALVSLLFAATPASAAITVNGISGTSVPWVAPPATGSTPATTSTTTIYAGTAGLLGAANPGALSTYDSCANPTTGSGLKACNDARIHAGLQLTFGFTSSTATGAAVMALSTTTTQLQVATGAAASPNVATSVTATWGQICTLLAGNGYNVTATCEQGTLGNSAVVATLNVGVAADSSSLSSSGSDAIQVTVVISNGIGQATPGADDTSVTDICANSPTGLCQFEAFPGDGKVIIRNPQLGTGTSSGGRSFQKVRILWVEGDGFANNAVFGQINSASLHQDLAFTSAGQASLQTDRITGFKNDTTYTMKAAVIDDTGNVGYYSNTTTNDADCTGVTDFPTNYVCHVVTPGEVLGVLANEFNCFIATATYGSGMAPQVQLFREFRNEYLLPSALGKKFVRAYYHNSPYYADIIAESPILRAVSRVALWPFVGVAWMYVHMGPIVATSFLVVLILAFIALARFTPALRTQRLGRRSPRE